MARRLTPAQGMMLRMVGFGVNAEHNREHNRRMLLRTLRRHGVLSRAELARLTGLTAQSITNIVGDLMTDRLVRAVGRRRGGRGQPPVELEINPAGGATIGVEIRPDGVTAVRADLDGAVVATAQRKLNRADPETIANILPPLVAELRSAPRRVRLLGVGVVTPSSFSARDAQERTTELPGWSDIADPAAFLSRILRAPTHVENDATAAAIAEHLYGAGRALTRIACLYLGRGLGLGLVLDGQVYRGATGSAGEIGHVVAEPNGRPCFCGQNGCFERYVSLDAALRDLGLPLAIDDPDAALRNAPNFGAWCDEAAERLARAVLMVENLFDPDIIILTGGVDALVRELAARLTDLPPALASRPGPRLIIGDAGATGAARGAAALPLYAITSADHSAGPRARQRIKQSGRTMVRASA